MDQSEPNKRADRDAFDKRISAALKNIEPPPGGLENLLAAMRQVQPEPAPILRPSSWTRRKWMGAAAAAIAGLAAPFTYKKFRSFDQGTGGAEPGTFIADSAHKASGLIHLSTQDASWEKLQTVQAENALPFSSLASTKLTHLEGKGCQGYDWRGFPVGLTCFKLADGEVAHIFSVSRQAFALNAPSQPTTAPTEVAKAANNYEHFSWLEKDAMHVLVAGSVAMQLGEVRASMMS